MSLSETIQSDESLAIQIDPKKTQSVVELYAEDWPTQYYVNKSFSVEERKGKPYDLFMY